MSKYYYLNENEYKLVVKNLSERKNFENANLKKNLEYQHNKLYSDNGSYVLAAKNNLSKFYSQLNDPEDLIIDDDANVSAMTNGAYVQCWMWVDSSPKAKKTKRQSK